MKTSVKNIIFTTVCFVTLFQKEANAAAAGVSYKYMGNEWSGTCATGKRQSPIDIPTGQVVELDSASYLKDLKRFLETSTTTTSTSTILAATSAGGVTISTPTTITTSCASSKTSETCS